MGITMHPTVRSARARLMMNMLDTWSEKSEKTKGLY